MGKGIGASCCRPPLLVLFPRAWGRRLDQSSRVLSGPLPLGEVDGQVVGEPAVSGPERLGLGRLVILHDAEAVVVGLEIHDPVVAHSELLLGSGEVDVLGGKTEQTRVLVHGFLPFDCTASEGTGAVVNAPGDPDAQSLGGAAPFPAHDGLDVVDTLRGSDQGLQLDQVKLSGAVDNLYAIAGGWEAPC